MAIKSPASELRRVLDEIVRNKDLFKFNPVMTSGGSGGLLGGLSGGIGSLLGFAHGGRPPVGQPSLVGERGPELFVPDRAGTIIPNSALGGGSITVNYNVDARGAEVGVERRIVRALREVSKSIEPRAVAAVQDARRRNPNLFR